MTFDSSLLVTFRSEAAFKENLYSTDEQVKGGWDRKEGKKADLAEVSSSQIVSVYRGLMFTLLSLTVGDIFAGLLAFMTTGWALVQVLVK